MLKKLWVPSLAALMLAPMRPVAGQSASGGVRPSTYCQILDHVSEPIYRVEAGYVSESSFEGFGEAGIYEIQGDWDFAYFRDIWQGDVDLNLRVRGLFFLDSAGINLPDELMKLAVEAGWTGRLSDGIGLQVRASPGIYSDLEQLDGGAIFCPFSAAIVRTFHPELSGIAGLEVRPSFERVVMPIVGVAWEINRAMRLEAGLPQSRFRWALNRDWSTHGTFAWQSASFRLGETGVYERDMMTVEDWRLSWGATYAVADQVQVTGELGWAFNRKVEFKEPVEFWDSDIDVEDAAFFRIGLSGPF